jgi:hypothetical protein
MKGGTQAMRPTARQGARRPGTGDSNSSPPRPLTDRSERPTCHAKTEWRRTPILQERNEGHGGATIRARAGRARVRTLRATERGRERVRIVDKCGIIETEDRFSLCLPAPHNPMFQAGWWLPGGRGRTHTALVTSAGPRDAAARLVFVGGRNGNATGNMNSGQALLGRRSDLQRGDPRQGPPSLTQTRVFL